MAFGAVGATVRTVLGIDDRGHTAGLRKADREVEGYAKRSQQHFLGMSKGMLGLAAGAAGLGSIGIALKSIVGAASDAEQAQARQRTQLEALNISYAAHGERIDAVIQKQSYLSAFDDEQLSDSFTNLVRATKDVNQALELNALAADIARAKQIDLETAANLVIKANMGLVGPLRRVGIEVEATTASYDRAKAQVQAFTDAHEGKMTPAIRRQVSALLENARAQDVVATKTNLVAQLQARFTGQADAYGRTAAGSVERLQVAWENAREELGMRLLPYLTRLANWSATTMPRLIDSFERWADSMRPTVNTIGSIVGALARANAAIERVQRAAGRLGVVFDAMPPLFPAQWFGRIQRAAERLEWLAGVARKVGLQSAASILEPFSHLPRGMGAWARKAKDAVNAQLDKISAQEAVDKIVAEVNAGTDAVAAAARAQGAAAAVAWDAGFQGTPTPFLDALTGTPTGLGGGQAPVGSPGGGNRGGTGIQLPTSQTSTHPTSGLPDYPAVDIFGKPGTNVLAPENGAITRVQGNAAITSGQTYGLGIYYDGFETGNGYFIKHLATAAPPGRYSEGDVIGTISPWSGGSPHVHFGIKSGGIKPQRPTSPAAAPRPGLPTPTTTPDTPAARPESPLITAGLRLRISEAELTKGLGDDIAALEAVEKYLEARIAKEKNVEKKIELLAELKSTRERIASLKEPGEEEDTDLIPKRLQLRLARAELTAGIDDDIAALNALESYFEKRLATEKDINKQLEILVALRSTRESLADRGRERAGKQEPLEKQIEAILGRGAPDVGGGGREPIMFTPAAAEAFSATAYAALQKVLASYKPQLDALRGYWQDLFNKRKAARERVAAINRTLKKLMSVRPKFRNHAAIAQWQQKRADYLEDIASLTAAMDAVAEQILDLDRTANDEAQRAANEAEGETAGAPSEPGGGGGFGGDGGGGGGGDSFADTGPPAPAITQAMMDAQRAEVLSARSGFFSEFGSDVYTGAPGSLSLGTAATVTVIQNFQTPPPDQHAYFQHAQFAAEHALG